MSLWLVVGGLDLLTPAKRKSIIAAVADILLVEDKDSLRRVLRLTLENAGYSVTEALTPVALNEIATSRHRLVLTDLRMPNGTGLDVLRSARAADADVPVIDRHDRLRLD